MVIFPKPIFPKFNLPECQFPSNGHFPEFQFTSFIPPRFSPFFRLVDLFSLLYFFCLLTPKNVFFGKFIYHHHPPHHPSTILKVSRLNFSTIFAIFGIRTLKNWFSGFWPFGRLVLGKWHSQNWISGKQIFRKMDFGKIDFGKLDLGKMDFRKKEIRKNRFWVIRLGILGGYLFDGTTMWKHTRCHI